MSGRARKGLNSQNKGEKEQNPSNIGGSDLSTRAPSESERVTKAEAEILTLKNALAKLEAEKEAGLLEYQQSLERLSDLEREVSRAQEDSRGLNERAGQAEAEVGTLKDALTKLEAERDSSLVQYRQCLEKITILRMGLYQMSRTLEIDAIHGYDDMIKHDQSVLDCIFGRLQKFLDEKQHFLIENSVLVGLLGQLNLEAENLATENNSLHQELKVHSEQFSEVENNLCDANAEVKGLRGKLKSLELSCLLLGDEKSRLLTQREGLISELNDSQERMEVLEKKYQGLEEKYIVLEKEKESMVCDVEELQRSLDAEKQEHATSVKLNESRATSMESRIHFLQGERLCFKKEYEEELDKAMNAHVETFILQKCAQDLEEKNLSLVLECRKLLEASKLSEELVSELELGNSIKQTEMKSLFDQIVVLRMGLYQMLRTLEIDAIHGYDDMIKKEESVLQKMQNSVLKSLDENQLFIIENSVLIGILRKLKLEAENVETENNALHYELKVQSEQFPEMHNKAEKLAVMNEELRSKVIEGGQKDEVLQTETGCVRGQLLELHRAYQSSIEEKRTLMKEV